MHCRNGDWFETQEVWFEKSSPHVISTAVGTLLNPMWISFSGIHIVGPNKIVLHTVFFNFSFFTVRNYFRQTTSHIRERTRSWRRSFAWGYKRCNWLFSISNQFCKFELLNHFSHFWPILAVILYTFDSYSQHYLYTFRRWLWFCKRRIQKVLIRLLFLRSLVNLFTCNMR